MFLESKLAALLNHLPDVYFHGSRHVNSIALTFDDGPSEQTGEIQDILEKYDAKGTFFVLGQNVKQDPGLVKAIDAQGSEVGNHSYSHKNLTFKDEGIISDELVSTEELLHELDIFPDLFRPPYGNLSPQLLRVARSEGYRTIMADVDPRDWKKDGSKRVLSYINRHTKPGSIINLHDNGDKGFNRQLPYILEETLKRFSDKGYSFETVSSLLYK
ncbi:MAG: polysaccharide deacetylase family protein [Nanobdellota archaeon]